MVSETDQECEQGARTMATKKDEATAAIFGSSSESDSSDVIQPVKALSSSSSKRVLRKRTRVEETRAAASKSKRGKGKAKEEGEAPVVEKKPPPFITPSAAFRKRSRLGPEYQVSPEVLCRPADATLSYGVAEKVYFPDAGAAKAVVPSSGSSRTIGTRGASRKAQHFSYDDDFVTEGDPRVASVGPFFGAANVATRVKGFQCPESLERKVAQDQLVLSGGAFSWRFEPLPGNPSLPILLAKNTTTKIGRTRETQLRDCTLSRNHIQVQVTADNKTVTLTPLHSSGEAVVTLNGRLLPKTEAVSLKRGDAVSLLYGQYAYRLVASSNNSNGANAETTSEKKKRRQQEESLSTKKKRAPPKNSKKELSTEEIFGPDDEEDEEAAAEKAYSATTDAPGPAPSHLLIYGSSDEPPLSTEFAEKKASVTFDFGEDSPLAVCVWRPGATGKRAKNLLADADREPVSDVEAALKRAFSGIGPNPEEPDNIGMHEKLTNSEAHSAFGRLLLFERKSFSKAARELKVRTGDLLAFYYGHFKPKGKAYDLFKTKNQAQTRAMKLAEAKKEKTESLGFGVPDDGNADECANCKGGGELLCCDTCERAFHLFCVGMDLVPDGDWSCPVCTSSTENKPNEVLAAAALAENNNTAGDII